MEKLEEYTLGIGVIFCYKDIQFLDSWLKNVYIIYSNSKIPYLENLGDYVTTEACLWNKVIQTKLLKPIIKILPTYPNFLKFIKNAEDMIFIIIAFKNIGTISYIKHSNQIIYENSIKNAKSVAWYQQELFEKLKISKYTLKDFMQVFKFEPTKIIYLYKFLDFDNFFYIFKKQLEYITIYAQTHFGNIEKDYLKAFKYMSSIFGSYRIFKYCEPFIPNWVNESEYNCYYQNNNFLDRVIPNLKNKEKEKSIELFLQPRKLFLSRLPIPEEEKQDILKQMIENYSN